MGPGAELLEGAAPRRGRWLQTNKHGVHLPRESECGRSVGSRPGLGGGCGEQRRRLRSSGRGPSAPIPTWLGEGRFLPPPHGSAREASHMRPGALAPEDRAGNQRSIGISGGLHPEG